MDYLELVGIIFLILVVSFGVFYFFNKPTVIYPPAQIAPSVPLNPAKEFLTYNVSLEVKPSPICVGQNVTGAISSNIPNGVCTIFVNTGTGFQVFANAILDSAGKYSVTQRIDSVWTATFGVTCCDTQGNCRKSNEALLTVTTAVPPCPPINPPSGNYTCGNSGLNCSGTCPTNYSCGLLSSETAQWCACITGGDSGTVHPDWKPDGANYHPTPIDQENCSTICTGKGFVSGRTVNSASECSGTEVFEANWNASLLCCCTPAAQEPNTCDGAIVPTGTGDAGAWCAARTGCQPFNGTPKVCDNYFNSVTQKQMCGCVMTFWCQDNFVYPVTGNNCVCSPSSQYQWIDSTHFKCV